MNNRIKFTDFSDSHYNIYKNKLRMKKSFIQDILSKYVVTLILPLMQTLLDLLQPFYGILVLLQQDPLLVTYRNLRIVMLHLEPIQ